MIKKLYDYREVTVPAALLQAEVTREEMDAELALAAARFTAIASVDGPVAAGDVVALEYTDDKGLHRIYANVGKGFDDLEDSLPGLSLGDKVQLRNAEATVVSVKRPTVPALTDDLGFCRHTSPYLPVSPWRHQSHHGKGPPRPRMTAL